MSLRNCLVVVWVYAVYVVGTCLFLSGYLMKHHIVYQNSTLNVNIGNSISCHNFSSLHNLYDEFIQGLEFSYKEDVKKSYLQHFNRAVIIIIDALRYDFVNSSRDRDGEFYLNKMPVFRKYVKKFPENSVLLPLIADPPTTTSQRLKGITTGSLPTFIDISRNFASSQIAEDNIIRQMNRMNKNIVFMGDDTWDSIFPNHFSRAFFYPSFNVKDLDTVDNGILDHIYEEIKRNSTDVLIAHFLGVDHCGHRYGPKHPEMSRKLLQMNDIMIKIIEILNKDTILFVLGDHGMTNTGDHGGDSTNETSTALFLYSPSKFVYDSNVHNLQSVAQIDIVPTLSLLLGLPIPFSNLGSIIPHLFSLNSDYYCFNENVDALLGGALAAAENALQIHRYLKVYSIQSKEFDNLFIMNEEERLKDISHLWKSVTHNVTHNLELISKIQIGFMEYTHNIFKVFEKKWATFNYEYMTVGLLLLCSAVSVNIYTAEQISNDHIIIILSFIAFIFVNVILFVFYSSHLLLPIIFLCCIFFTFIIRFKTHFFQCILNLFSVQSLILFILFFCSFSNSFVVYEDRIILYLLQSVIFYKYYPFVISFFKQSFQTNKMRLSKQNQKINYVELLLLMCLMLCIRIGSVFFKCREEQMFCVDSNFTLSLEKLHMPQSYKILRLFLSLASVIVPVVVFLYLSSCKSSTKFRTATSVSIRYGIFFVCVFTSLRWWLNIVSPEAVERVLKGNEVMLTRAASFISVTISIILILFPILSEKSWTLSSKEIYSESLGSLLFIVSQLLYLIAGDAVSSAITLMSASILLHVILSDLSTNAGEPQIWIDVLIWNLSSRYWFYASAHQATFSSVQWDAAFLLTHKEIYSYTLSCALVIINTFSSNILHGLALPAILVWSQPTACSTTSIRRLHLKYIFCFGIKLIGHAIAALILRRHLMAWKIFSPRLLYEVIGTVITMVTCCISHYFILSVISQYHKLIRKNLGHMFSDKNQ